MDASIDELLDQLQAHWLSAVEFGRPGGNADGALFRICYGPTVGGMQFSLAKLQQGAAGHAMYFVPEARDELKQQIAILMDAFEQPDAVDVPPRERAGGRGGKAPGSVHRLYPVSDEWRHSAR